MMSWRVIYLQEAQDDFDLDEMEQGNEVLG